MEQVTQEQSADQQPVKISLVDAIKTIGLASTMDIKHAVRSLNGEDIDFAINRLQKAGKTKLEQLEKEREEAEERKKTIAAVLADIKSKGLDLSDLTGDSVATLKAPKKARKATAQVKIKYKYTDGEGQEHTWTGRGKTPLVFAELKSNGTLEQYLVQEEQQQQAV